MNVVSLGIYCKRHDQYAENGVCPWCVPETAPAVQPQTAPAVQAARTCDMRVFGGRFDERCGKPAMWLWTPAPARGATGLAFVFCQDHHLLATRDPKAGLYDQSPITQVGP